MDQPQEWRSGTSSASSDEHLPTQYLQKGFRFTIFQQHIKGLWGEGSEDQWFWIPAFMAFLTLICLTVYLT